MNMLDTTDLDPGKDFMEHLSRKGSDWDIEALHWNRDGRDHIAPTFSNRLQSVWRICEVSIVTAT